MLRILLAEDDLLTRKFMTDYLSRFGECDVTVDGMEALDAFVSAMENREPYDLVCLDILMPIMDGYQTLRGIRHIENMYQIPKAKAAVVVMTTALMDESSKKQAFDLGCDIYSGKPIDKDLFERELILRGMI